MLSMDRDTVKIAVIAVLAVVLARMFVPKIPVVGDIAGPYL